MVINDYRRSSIKFDVRGIRISADEIFFYTGLVLWLIQVYISRTVYINTFGNRLVTVIRYFCMLIFAVKIVLTEKTIQKRAAAVFLIAAALFVVVQRQIHTGMPLIQILLLVYAARNIPFKRICTVMLWTCLPLWLLPVMTDKIGIHQLERSIYIQRVREYLNFNYVSFPSIYFNNIIYCALYVFTDPRRLAKGGKYEAEQKTASWILILILSAAAFWVYRATDTSLPLLIAGIYIALYVAVVKLRIQILKNNLLWRIIALGSFPVLAVVSYIMAKNYNWRVGWQFKLDQMTHNRVSLAYQGIKNYGVHLFGTQIVENTDTTKGRYFYIDSGYIKNMINYGLIVFVLILIYYTVIFYAAVVENDKVLVIWMICVAFYSLFNNLLLSPAENGSLFAFWYAADLLAWHGKKKNRKRVFKRKEIERAA